jgi:hypothetical protein
MVVNVVVDNNMENMVKYPMMNVFIHVKRLKNVVETIEIVFIVLPILFVYLKQVFILNYFICEENRICFFLDSTCSNAVVGYQGCFDGTTLSTVMDVVNSIEECVTRCAMNYNYAGMMNG